MTTAVAELPEVAYSIADDAIEQLAAEYLPLTIRDQDDAHGYKLVREARLDVKARRVAIEKTRKALKADALEYGRKVDGEAKRLTALLEPIETHLQAEEDAYNAEKERIRREAEEKRRAKLQARMDALRDVRVYHMAPEDVEELNDEEFHDLLVGHRQAFEAEQAREAAEAEARRKEAEQLAAERAKLDAERKRQEEEAAKVRAEQEAAAAKLRAEQEKIDAEKRRLAAEEAERRHKEELEQARKEAAERAKREAEDQRVREEAEAKARAEAEEAERKRIEALRPDSEKLMTFADQLEELLVPELSEASSDAFKSARFALADCANRIRDIAGGMIGK